MSGTPRLMAALMDGGGLRVSECCELRLKDLDFDQGLVVIRRGKGDKDRSTLPDSHRGAIPARPPQQIARMTSDRVMMKVLSLLKSRTRTAGLSGVIIVESSSTGVEMSTNGNAGCMIDSTG